MRAALVVLALVAGCARGTAIESWTLDVEGGPSGVAVTLPSNYLDDLPLRPIAYTMRTTIAIAGGHEAHTIAAKGTPRASATAADDILAFDRLAHELVTGEAPIGSSDAELATLPSPLGVVVARCLDADPARRPTAAELVEALA